MKKNQTKMKMKMKMKKKNKIINKQMINGDLSSKCVF